MKHLRQADGELVTLFTQSQCLAAQHYEPRAGVGFDSHEHMLNSVRSRAHRPPSRSRLTLQALSPEHRGILEDVYGRGAGTFERGTKELALDVDFLVRALAPRWGHGTFFGIVGQLPRAQRAHARRKAQETKALERRFETRRASMLPCDVAAARRVLYEAMIAVDRQPILEFLRHEAQPDRAKETKSFFAQLVIECEGLRTPALTAYAAMRRSLFGRDREATPASTSPVDEGEARFIRLVAGEAA